MESIIEIEKAVKAMGDNVNKMISVLYGPEVEYKKWVEYYLEYKALKRFDYYGEGFVSLAKELADALLDAEVICTSLEEVSVREWKRSLQHDLGKTKKLEIY